MSDGIYIFTVFLVIISFLVGRLIGFKPSGEKCLKCGCLVDVTFEYGKTYEVKKCRSCKWKSKKDLNSDDLEKIEWDEKNA